jgi:hypothetical protein
MLLLQLAGCLEFHAAPAKHRRSTAAPLAATIRLGHWTEPRPSALHEAATRPADQPASRLLRQQQQLAPLTDSIISL